jgi:hypothetical protein
LFRSVRFAVPQGSFARGWQVNWINEYFDGREIGGVLCVFVAVIMAYLLASIAGFFDD